MPALQLEASPPLSFTAEALVVCGNCGFRDSGHYCSRCGDGLHDTEASVLRILWEDLVAGHVHDLFALSKTTWMILVHPCRFFHGVLKERRGMADHPFPLRWVWARVSEKPQAVHNAVKFFVIVYTLSILVSWFAGEELFGDIHLWRDKPLPEHLAEALVLVAVVLLVWMYAAGVALVAGRRRVQAGALTKFLLYAVGLALMAFVTAVLMERHPDVLWGCLAVMLYSLFVLPQVVLPRLYGVGRVRLAFAQVSAVVTSLLAAAVLLFATVFVYTAAETLLESATPSAATTPATIPPLPAE